MRAQDGFPPGVADERRLTRRAFLGAGAATLALTWAGDWLARRVWRRGPEAHAGLRLASVAELAPGDARAFTVPGSERAALLVRVDPETVVAFERRCPHLGCPVLWSAAHARFECPCHRAAFAAHTGHVLHGPPRAGLTPLAIETRGDDIWLRAAPVGADAPADPHRPASCGTLASTS